MLVTFETNDNYSIRFSSKWKTDYSHSTKKRHVGDILQNSERVSVCNADADDKLLWQDDVSSVYGCTGFDSQIRPEPEPDLRITCFSDHRTIPVRLVKVVESNGVNNAVSCYKETV